MLPGTARFDGMTLPPGRTIGVLSVHEARHALGQWLRELRQQAGLTGRQVADLLSWPASKASKLENGRQTPTDDDVRGWASVTHARCCRWACPSLDNRIGVLDNQECTLGEGVISDLAANSTEPPLAGRTHFLVQVVPPPSRHVSQSRFSQLEPVEEAQDIRTAAVHERGV
jgi:transcriptional regulator with XRE-family HTH domain